ncbi:hypothetical protein JIG36_37095 [Actinoplanes sp. LDG1-06]|uniref:Uncharacterized protein n=1 Tax=Paractinoplanes ovalisporus TaxID=2810368 RepID=A0ABS2AMP2_9ACTN|nr:hypothetical protein [Actinoplanes ovalisporus]MBM2621133.1 hypothetical protein [Actinoplanes ovalisporus]
MSLTSHEAPPSPSPESLSTPVPAALPGEALQVLTLAQRTAEEYVAAANKAAQAVREEAETNAEHCRQEAREYAEQMRSEADKLLTAARATAELTHREAQVQAADIRRQAELLLTEARAEAESIVAGGNETAEQLEQRAQRRYEDAVGGLSVKRKALQEQIETLEIFDAEYRRRLMAFLQGQLRALWADQPQAATFPAIELQLPGGPVDTA